MRVPTAIVIALLLLIAESANAQTMRFDLGLRTLVKLGDGEPANDMLGNGVFAQYRFNERWGAGVAFETIEYDFEQPARILGLVQDSSAEPVDASADTTIVTVWLRRNFPGGRARTSWFWGVGAGFASASVDDAGGVLVGGGHFDIETDAGSEMIAGLTGGAQIRLVDRWYFELAVCAEQHFADWEVHDRVSGRTANISDYLTTGGHAGIGIRF